MFQQLEESGCQGMLDTLALVCAELEWTRTQRRETLATLQTKKEQIEQFAKTTVSTVLNSSPHLCKSRARAFNHKYSLFLSSSL